MRHGLSFASMKTYAVKARSKKAEALLEQLAALGLIEMETLKAPQVHLADMMRTIRSGVKQPLPAEEVTTEVERIRAKRHAAAKKAQARR
jgi:hypothetical protein